MTKYQNKGWDSNIVSYENGEDYIKVEFASGRDTVYTYTYWSAWSWTIETMKSLAIEWKWLNSYISRNKPNYNNKC